MELVRPRCIAVPTQGDRPQGFSPYISAGFPILAGRCGGANLEISLVYGACFVPSSWQPEQYELWEYFQGEIPDKSRTIPGATQRRSMYSDGRLPMI